MMAFISNLLELLFWTFFVLLSFKMETKKHRFWLIQSELSNFVNVKGLFLFPSIYFVFPNILSSLGTTPLSFPLPFTLTWTWQKNECIFKQNCFYFPANSKGVNFCLTRALPNRAKFLSLKVNSHFLQFKQIFWTIFEI